MECSSPPPLTDDQLSAALDQTATLDVIDHLAKCASCATRLDAAQQAEQSLRSALYRWDCPAPQTLAEYHLGRPSADEQRAIVRHLETCARCSEEIAELVLFMRDEAAVAAPEEPSPARRPAARGWSLARLLPRVPALALRGGAGGPLMFETDDGATIFLELQPVADGQVELRGQLVADDQDDWAGALVELRQAGMLRATAAIDDLGTFRVATLPPQPTELRATRADGRALLLPEFELTS
jgi:anti-sigma factor RsiW